MVWLLFGARIRQAMEKTSAADSSRKVRQMPPAKLAMFWPPCNSALLCSGLTRAPYRNRHFNLSTNAAGQ